MSGDGRKCTPCVVPALYGDRVRLGAMRILILLLLACGGAPVVPGPVCVVEFSRHKGSRHTIVRLEFVDGACIGTERTFEGVTLGAASCDGFLPGQPFACE